MNHKLSLTVIVAAYNEQAIIAANVKNVYEFLEKSSFVSWELICVNDGSADKTGVLLDEAAAAMPKLVVLHHRRNFGQGQALRSAFAQAKGEVIVTLDADLSYGPEYITLLYNKLHQENADIALASAYMKGGQVINVPFYRYFLSRVGNWYLARMSNYKISTSTCVVRAYRADCLHALRLNASGMELQLESLMKASIHEMKVVEVPAILKWDIVKAKEAAFTRASKMRIMRSIRLYLMLGWLAKPTAFMLLAALLFFIPGLYMAIVLCYRFFEFLFTSDANTGISELVSLAMAHLFNNYTYSLAFCGIFLFLGFQLMIFSLLFLQNKHYYEDKYLSATVDDASKLQNTQLPK